jgi:hypothetical protein
MGVLFPPLYGKSKFYEKKKAKALAKIAKNQEIVDECNKAIAEQLKNEVKTKD